MSENDAAKRPQRDARGRLLPGHGMPGPGRPKLPEWFRGEGEEALKVLRDVMHGRLQDDKVSRAQAAQYVVERIYGKAPQAVEDTATASVLERFVTLLEGKPENE